LSNKKRLILSLTLLSSLATLAVFGTFAVFNASATNTGNTFATGTLSMSASPATTVATLSNMVPGDSITGLITLTNTGTEDIVGYQVATTATVSSLLDNPAGAVSAAPCVGCTAPSAAKGLQLWVSRCTAAWTGTGAAATCSGTVSDVAGTSAAPVGIMTTTSLGTAFCTTNAAVTAAIRTTRGTTCSSTGTDYLKMRISLPTAADNQYQGMSSTLTFTFSGQSAPGASF
jgi:hypothetical protein